MNRNTEERRTYQRQWATANRDKVRAAHRAWAAANPTTVKASRKKWASANLDKRRTTWRRLAANARLRCLSHYSHGSMACACCGEREIKFLTFDHIEGRGGMGHRRTMTGSRFCSWAIKNNFPLGVQILCFNCNCAKGSYGQCPHQERKTAHASATR